MSLSIRLNRKLHFLASRLVDNPHDFLHDLAVRLFGVKSMKELSEEDGYKMLEILTYDWGYKNLLSGDDAIYDAKRILYNDKDEMFITERQKEKINELIKELGWSEEYLDLLVKRRYQELNWETMPRYKAFKLISYLIKRKRERKGKNEKRRYNNYSSCGY